MLTNFHINPEEFGLGRSASLQMSGNSLIQICVLLALGLQTLQITPEAPELSSLPGTDLMTPVILMVKAIDIYNAQSPKPKIQQTIKKTTKPTPKPKKKKATNIKTTTRMSLFPRRDPPPSTPEPVVVKNPYTMSYRATDSVIFAKLGSRSYMQELLHTTTKKTTQSNN